MTYLRGRCSFSVPQEKRRGGVNPKMASVSGVPDPQVLFPSLSQGIALHLRWKIRPPANGLKSGLRERHQGVKSKHMQHKSRHCKFSSSSDSPSLIHPLVPLGQNGNLENYRDGGKRIRAPEWITCSPDRLVKASSVPPNWSVPPKLKMTPCRTASFLKVPLSPPSAISKAVSTGMGC